MNSSIYDAFATQVATFAAGSSPALPVAYPGVHFDSPAAGYWLELAWFPNETQNYGLGNDGPSLMQGFGQIAVCHRPGSGVMGGLAIADSVINAFRKGTAIGSAKVEREPWVSAVVIDGDKVMHPVTVRWKRFAARAG